MDHCIILECILSRKYTFIYFHTLIYLFCNRSKSISSVHLFMEFCFRWKSYKILPFSSFLIDRSVSSYRSSKPFSAKCLVSTKLSKLAKSSAVWANLLKSQASFGVEGRLRGEMICSSSSLPPPLLLHSKALRRTLDGWAGAVSHQMINLNFDVTVQLAMVFYY